MFHEAVSLPGFLEKKALVCTEAVCSMDEAAFSALYRSIAPALQGYIRKICGNASLAEDILQETFYRLLRADLPEMDAHQMKSYLFKIATSLLVDHWRREKREKFWQHLWHPPAMTQGEQMSDVAHALSALKPAERALLWLAYVEGFDHGEIASTLGLKDKSVRVLLFRARKNMARIMRLAGGFDKRLMAAYEHAKTNGLWKGTYAMQNRMEYWAEGAQSWFDTNRANDNEHGPVDTRDKIGRAHV